ncbi:Berardinelli-Seip congenital lipodystrophy 2 (seipin) [Cytospora paraplurivora]|uniref:Berardinelli-Seip congenital lipodystrophy 2 (Seipin) n=1 Tax=Cytospora paraplurivora TaxID=2898453 RepID=A0AAN9U8F8_9PEZI
MPCFKGIAVSIHANGAPLAEYGMQKQSKFSRINTFIPVPSPTLAEDSGKTESAKFAISITLLTPGLPIPYSTPKPTPDNPDPTPQFAARDMATSRTGSGVNPYIPMTNSENETVAAYIYFDGRAKEEVATLLRPGEETWVNSRWVQVPDSEGGGLAEREFLFREVGLERWLNGLDLQGHDAEDRLAKRRLKFERRRRKQRAEGGEAAMNDDDDKTNGPRDALRYGNDETSPVEDVLDDDSMSDSDDEFPEAAGQIKVAMFRVIASGEIKKGEYSPQFGAHDDDDELDGGNKNGVDADVEHTTSFAKPKTLDPKTISTQTVTGIDGPEKPYATFTFYYRGDKQLQKMGVLPSTKAQVATPVAAKRRSAQLDFSNLGPLKTTGTVGFSTFRDSAPQSTKRRKNRKKSNGSLGAMDEDSDDDDDDDEPEILGKMEDIDEKDVKVTEAPEDVKFTGELAEGVDRIRLKRQRSNEPEGSPTDPRSPNLGANLPANSPPTATGFGGGILSGVPSLLAQSLPDDAAVGSPLKKQRAGTLDQGTGRPLQPPVGTSASTSAPAVPAPVLQSAQANADEEEEL